MTTTLDVFISSKMVELKAERDALYALLPTLDYGDIKLRAWVFEEDAPASEKSIRDVYLKALQNSALYLGLFWNLYGEYTIDEFDRATEWGMERHIYVKDVDANKRDSQLDTFLRKHGDVPTGITAKWFKTTDELRAAVKHSIESWIVERLRSRPGGTSAILASDADDLSERPRKLIGRDDLLGDIAKLLDSGEQVLLQGFGGMGKTALAATAAGEWIRAGKGAVLWLKTGSASADALFEALARPFNAQQAIAGQQDDAKIQAVRQLLRDSGVKLLVLDDCWNGQALFTVLKAVPTDMPVLATARQRFALDNMLDVGELKPDDALTLLLHHAKLTPPPSPLPSVAEFREGEQEKNARALCKTLGNHAFAIEVAGKTLKARKWTPAELLQEIKDAPHDLKTPAEFNQAERKSIKDLLDTSVNILNDEERAIFLAFGAFFAPQLTAQMLKLYFNPPLSLSLKGIFSGIASLLRKAPILRKRPHNNAIDVTYALNSLSINGLVERIHVSKDTIEHYRVHDLAYSYARAQANDDQQRRALDACLSYIKRHNEPSLPNFAALRPELDNLIGAAGWAYNVGNYKDAERFAWDLYAQGSEILDYDGLYTQAIKLLTRSVEAAQLRGDKRREEHRLGSLGSVYSNLGYYRHAIDFNERALEIDRQIGDKHGEGIRLGNLGNAYSSLGDYPRAIVYHQQALKIARQIGYKRGEGIRLGNLGNAYSSLGEYRRAIMFYEQALKIARQIGYKLAEGYWLDCLGSVYRNLRDYRRAIEFHEQALVISHQIGDKRGEGSILDNLGSAYRNLGEYRRAVDFYEQAIAIYEVMGLEHEVERVNGNLAIARQKRAENARDEGDTLL